MHMLNMCSTSPYFCQYKYFLYPYWRINYHEHRLL